MEMEKIKTLFSESKCNVDIMASKFGDYHLNRLFESQLYNLSNLTNPKIEPSSNETQYVTTNNGTLVIKRGNYLYITGKDGDFKEKATFAHDIVCNENTVAYVTSSKEMYIGSPGNVTFFKKKVLVVALGKEHVCFLEYSSSDYNRPLSLYGYGNNKYGQLGVNIKNVKTPIQLSSDATRVACGDYHTVYLSRECKGIFTAGMNNKGQLGTGNLEDSNVFQQIAKGVTYSTIRASYDMTGIISGNKILFVCGDNSKGQLCLDPEKYPIVTSLTPTFENVSDVKFGKENIAINGNYLRLYVGGLVNDQIHTSPILVMDQVVSFAIDTKYKYGIGINHKTFKSEQQNICDTFLSDNETNYIIENFVKDGQINMSGHDINKIYDNFGHLNIEYVISDVIVNKGVVSFPYKKYGLNVDDVWKMFNRLVNYVPNFVQMRYKLRAKTDRYLIPWKYNEEQIVLLIGEGSYEDIDQLSDYFSEKYRARAIRKDVGISPYEKWQDITFVENIVQKALQNQNKITSKTLRDEIFLNIKEETQFKPTIAFSFYKTFEAENILDISAGWGDRLLAAIAYGAKSYLAYDPNTNLKQAHNDIINTFAKGDNKRFKVVYEPFETAKFPKGYETDLIFSSLPYFDLGQSIQTFPNFDDWLVSFLFASFKNAWSVLSVDGIMAIHMTDLRYNKIVEPMVLYVITFLKNSDYIGVIPSHNPHSPKAPFVPIWLFQKTTEPSHDYYNAEKLFYEQYNDLYNKSRNL